MKEDFYFGKINLFRSRHLKDFDLELCTDDCQTLNVNVGFDTYIIVDCVLKFFSFSILLHGIYSEAYYFLSFEKSPVYIVHNFKEISSPVKKYRLLSIF